MDISRLYQDFNITYATEGHKHTHENWVHTACPFCTGNPGLHLGFNQIGNYHSCWRCGWHSTYEVVSTLLNIKDPQKVKEIIRQYDGYVYEAPVKVDTDKKPFTYPPNTLPLQPNHKARLVKRGYDPEAIIRDWDVMGTGVYSILDKIDFSHRFIIPVYWEGKVVTYLARSIREKIEFKYLVCSDERAVMNINDTIYGKPEYWGDFGIVVEGVTDVWKLGFESVALYGVKYKTKQVRLISKNFKRVVVIFDPDVAGQESARKLVADLKFRGLACINYVPDKDPGSMGMQEAKELVAYLKTII